MDEAVMKDSVWYIGQFWSFAAVALAIALAGVAVKRAMKVLVPDAPDLESAVRTVKRISLPPKDGEGREPSVAVRVHAKLEQDRRLPGWFRLWYATLAFHPVLVGGVVGLFPLPVPAFCGSVGGTPASILWFMGAGAVSGQLYEIVRRTAEMVPGLIRSYFGGSSSSGGTVSAPPGKSDAKPDDEGP